MISFLSAHRRTIVILAIYLGLIGQYISDRPFLHFTKLFAAGNLMTDMIQEPTVYLNVNIIYTGQAIDQESIAHLSRFRHDFPGIPIFHFINPVYFISANSEKNHNAISSLVDRRDQIGLYLAPSSALLQKLLIKPRTEPNLWGTNPSSSIDTDSTLLKAFTSAELLSMIHFGKSQLESTFRQPIQLFMSHDWSHEPSLTTILEAEKIRYNFSAVSTKTLAPRLQGYHFFNSLKRDWSYVNSHTPVHLDPESYFVTLIPQTAATIDYLSSDAIKVEFEKMANQARLDPIPHRIFSLSIHASRANQTTEKLMMCLRKIFASNSLGVNIKFLDKPLDLNGIKIEPPHQSASNPNSEHSL